MPPLSPLQETLLVLAALKNQLEPALKVVKRHICEDDTKFTVTNHILVLVTSFLQEWKRLEGLGSDIAVRMTLKAAAPALKRIRQWNGLFRLRSSALAHGFRNKDSSLVDLNTLFGARLAPSTYAEQMLLGELAVYAIATALCQHAEAAALASGAVYANGPTAVQDAGITTMRQFEDAVSNIRASIIASDPSLESCFAGGRQTAP